jgi:histidine ammonia-lyase
LGLTGEQITFTFNADNTYTASIKGRVIQGTYALDVANKKLTLTYLNGLGTITPQIAKTGNKMSLLYDADKLLKFLTTISAVSNNSTLKSLSTLLESYDGMLIGWELQK